MPHNTPDCVCVCVWVSMGVFAQSVCMLPFMCVCSQCRSVCVVCVCCSPCCLLCPLCSNAVETLMQQTQPQADWVRWGGGEGRKKLAVSKETFLPVVYCMFKLYWTKFLVYIERLIHFGSFVFASVCDALRIIILIHGCPWSCHFLFMSVYICSVYLYTYHSYEAIQGLSTWLDNQLVQGTWATDTTAKSQKYIVWWCT